MDEKKSKENYSGWMKKKTENERLDEERKNKNKDLMKKWTIKLNVGWRKERDS